MLEKNEITNEIIKKFIEWHDDQERIVNLYYKYKDDFISVIYRDENDHECIHKEPFYPFVWATRSVCNQLYNGNRDEIKNSCKNTIYLVSH